MNGPAQEWPPSATMVPGNVTGLIMFRLRHEAGLVCVRQTGATLTDRGWQARVGLLPHTEENIEAVRSALVPMEVHTVPIAEVNRPFV